MATRKATKRKAPATAVLAETIREAARAARRAQAELERKTLRYAYQQQAAAVKPRKAAAKAPAKPKASKPATGTRARRPRVGTQAWLDEEISLF